MIEWQKSTPQLVTSSCLSVMSPERGHKVILCCALNSPLSSLSPPLLTHHLLSFPPLLICPLCLLSFTFFLRSLDNTARAYLSLSFSPPPFVSQFLSLPPPFLPSLLAGGGGCCKTGGSAWPHPRLFARLICGGSGLRRTAYCTQWKSLRD